MFRAASLASILLAGAAHAAEPAEFTTSPDIVYATVGDAKLKLDLVAPKGPGPHPCLVCFHGGAWKAGNRKDLTKPAIFAPGGKEKSQEFSLLEMLARKGYAAASVSYRLAPGAKFPAQIIDAKTAVRFLRTNAVKYDLDPERFGALGFSAGGHLAALLGTTGDVPESGDTKSKTSSRVSAVCDWFGPTDLSKLAPDGGASSPITKLLGGTPTAKAKAKLAEQANPIAHISKGDAAFLTFHGDKDALVPLSQSEILHEALTKAGIESELVVLKGANHGDGEFLSQVSSEANRKKLVEFFDKHLKK